MLIYGFKILEFYHYVYINKYGHDNYITLLLYADDMVIVGRGKIMINRVKNDLGNHIVMTNLGTT